jgi:hypothetical protein
MERPATFANTWLILKTIAFIVALEGVTEYFADGHYLRLARRYFLLLLEIAGYHAPDPANPPLPKSWEEWYNS